jgi:ketosteroid isomerase-like protein
LGNLVLTPPAELAWSFWEALSDGEVDQALALVDPSGTWWSRSIGELPMPVISRFLRAAIEHFPMQFTLHDVHGSSDTVVLEVESLGDPGGVGPVYNNRYCFVMTVSDGRIVRVHEYTDTLHASQVLLARLPTDVVALLVTALDGHGG